MTLRSNNLQSDNDLDSIRNSCDVYHYHYYFFLLSILCEIETKSGKVGEAAERIADAVDNVSEVDHSFVEFLSLLADFYSDTFILFSQDDCVIFPMVCLFVFVFVFILTI